MSLIKNTEPSGVICIDKPAEHTSFDVIARMRGITHIKKIGHGGTLDPMATGVLPIFIGRATKACDILPVSDKKYRATFKLGLTTDTQDITGTVLTKADSIKATKADVLTALQSFRGDIKQLPPMYSAIQVNGQRLYDLARQGIEVEREERQATIHSLELVECNENEHEYTIEIFSSRGTYIRTICHDIGELLGCGAVMTALRRTMSCGFNESDCVSLEEATGLMAEGKLLTEHMLPIERAFDTLYKITLDEKLTRLYLNGIRLDVKRTKAPTTGEDIAMYAHDGTFLGVSFYSENSKLLELRNLFYLI